MSTNDRSHPSPPPASAARAVQARPAPVPLTGIARPGSQGTVLGCAPEPAPEPLRWFPSPALDDEPAAADLVPGAVPGEIAARTWCADGDGQSAHRRRVRHRALVRVVRPRTTDDGRC